MQRVNGIGGVFLRGRDHEALPASYEANLDAMLEQLGAAGARVEDNVEEMEFGRFGWGFDPAGNRFELWQPT
jgi:glyoxylase I family protein